MIRRSGPFPNGLLLVLLVSTCSFFRNFSTVAAPMISYLKKGLFIWFGAMDECFNEIKEKLSQALVLALSDFWKIFQVDNDAFHIDIGAIIS